MLHKPLGDNPALISSAPWTRFRQRLAKADSANIWASVSGTGNGKRDGILLAG